MAAAGGILKLPVELFDMIIRLLPSLRAACLVCRTFFYLALSERLRRTGFTDTVIMHAVETGDLWTLSLAKERSVDLNERRLNDHVTPLSRAIKHGRIAVVQWLVSIKVDLEIPMKCFGWGYRTISRPC
jgi:hypothetical protein